jgi:hypothetical protein
MKCILQVLPHAAMCCGTANAGTTPYCPPLAIRPVPAALLCLPSACSHASPTSHAGLAALSLAVRCHNCPLTPLLHRTGPLQDLVVILLFDVAPQVADIAISCTYLAVHVQPWAALIVLATVCSYVPLTICITERRGVIRKRMNGARGAACCQLHCLCTLHLIRSASSWPHANLLL